jgi:sugar lactone lactonase YvrE
MGCNKTRFEVKTNTPAHSLPSMFRHAVIVPGALLVLWMNKDWLGSKLFPYGVPQRLYEKNRPSFSSVDPSNDSLRQKHGKLQKIYQRRGTGEEDRLLRSAETVFFGPDGTLYATTDQGYLISLTDFEKESDVRISAKTTLIKDLGKGRPLGAKFTSDGSMIYIADAALGLLRLLNPHEKTSKVEIVSSSVMDGGKRTSFNFLDDVAIGPKSGKVYFTDASTVPPPRNPDLTFDAMYASKVDALMGAPSGRLLEYDPATDEIKILARNLSFANGVAVDKDEKYVVFTETFRLSVGKYHLTGDKQGQIENIGQDHPSPAYVDGVDCAWSGQTAKSSYCFAANPGYVVAANRFLWGLPHPLVWILRTMLIMLPKEWLPKTDPYGGITILDPEYGFVALIQDPFGSDIGHIAGVTVHENKLFLGSLENDFIGVYDLN